MHLNGAMLFVKDFPRMRDFYASMLQALPGNQEWADSYAVFAFSGGSLELHAVPAEQAGDIEVASPPQVREDNPVKLVFAVDDVSAARSRLERMGATLSQRPWQTTAESCDAVDPEGNVFQIRCRPRDPKAASSAER